MSVADKPIALYVHWPWCVRKCPYCDFNSHAIGAGVDEAGYIQALLQDVDAAVEPTLEHTKLHDLPVTWQMASTVFPLAFRALTMNGSRRSDVFTIAGRLWKQSKRR